MRIIVHIEIELDSCDEPTDQAPPVADTTDQAKTGWFDQLDANKRRARREAAQEQLR